MRDSSNQKLMNDSGNKIIGDNALVAITIMIAESKTEEKGMMDKLVVNLMTDPISLLINEAEISAEN